MYQTQFRSVSGAHGLCHAGHFHRGNMSGCHGDLMGASSRHSHVVVQADVRAIEGFKMMFFQEMMRGLSGRLDCVAEQEATWWPL